MDGLPGTIRATRDKARTLVALRGEIDLTLRDEASAALAAGLIAGLPVVVDLEGVTFMDSTGIAFLVQYHLSCSEAGLACRMEHVPDAIRDLFDIAGLGTMLPAREPTDLA